MLRNSARKSKRIARNNGRTARTYQHFRKKRLLQTILLTPALRLESTDVIGEFDSDIPPPIVNHAKRFEGFCLYSSQA